MKGSNYFWFLMSFLSGVLISGIMLLLLSNKPNNPITLIPAPTPLPIKVYLSGDISHPGVYELQKGSRLEDLLIIANVNMADLNNLNLASKLFDGQHIQITTFDYPQKYQVFQAVSDERININEANLKELTSLPGIGETKAQEIIKYREAIGYFDKIEDILKVPGIGNATYEQIKEMITTNSIN